LPAGAFSKETISGRTLRKTELLAAGSGPFAASCPQSKPGRKEKNPVFKNNVEIIGFLGRDGEPKTANSNGNEFTVLSVATQESWKDKETGEWHKATEWHSVICNNGLGKYAATLTKGTHVLIEGVLRSRTYTLQVGSGKKKDDKQIRTWFIKATSVKKLDRLAKDSDGSEEPTADLADNGEVDF
jgi:single-strand DNA-binding protein